MPIYQEILAALAAGGAAWVQIDEPILVTDQTEEDLEGFRAAYAGIGEFGNRPKVVVSTYFGHLGEALGMLMDLPIEGVGLDLCAGGENIDLLAAGCGGYDKTLFAGVVDGRNVWVNDLHRSLSLLERMGDHTAEVVVSTSCSLAHVPYSVAQEDDLDPQVRAWLAFAHEKLGELTVLAKGFTSGHSAIAEALEANQAVIEDRRTSQRCRNAAVRARVAGLDHTTERRPGTPQSRAQAQKAALKLPPLPTTTIGSFPQTTELRAARAAWRANTISDQDYDSHLRAEIQHVIALQEEVGLDVLVHGEAERDDMVRYFADQMEGFALPKRAWVQSYGSRYVRPPILFGDPYREAPMTLPWACYAASLTDKPVKGMLTGPVTMLEWSFVRDDQAPAETATALGLAIADEVEDLQTAGIAIIQVDEPALREGLPLRRDRHDDYLKWATYAFRVAVAPAREATQVHTHMCYADFHDIAPALAELDMDVISLEAARSAMAEIGSMSEAAYVGGVGPGVYDVHAPRIPSADEMAALLAIAAKEVGTERVWANPDCGLKTRSYPEVRPALKNLVIAAHQVRRNVLQGPN